MKKILLSLATFALVLPAYAMEGEGTEANPFKVTKAEDFAEIEKAPEGSYFILMNDIDFTGVTYNAPFQGSKTSPAGKIYFNGNYHVLSNIDCKSANAGVFGLIDGYVKNLGVENSTFDCLAASSGWGPSGVIAAYAGLTASATIENCYAEKCNVLGSYAGGIIGGTKYEVVIKDCYSSANCKANDFGGGLIGAINYGLPGIDPTNVHTKATIINCYASGKIEVVKASGMGGGIVGGNQNYDHQNKNPDGTETVDLTDVVALNSDITAATANAIANTTATPALIVNKSNVYIYDQMMINGVGVEAADNVKDEDSLIDYIVTWPAFTEGDVTMPVLKWQKDGGSTGIADVAVEESEAAPVYYNLQGVEVKNPDGGFYIVRRGSKVTKEVIR